MPTGQTGRGGGELLRSLRKARTDAAGRRLTIEGVARAAGFDYRTISDIERGVIPTPSLPTIQRIFAALDSFGDVTVADKNMVLQAYGYHPILVPPTPAEIERACRLWLEEHQHTHLPAYLVSYNQRLLVWNRYAPRMLGLTIESLPNGIFEHVTVFDLVFNPQLPSTMRLLNAEELAPKLLTLMKAEMRPFRDEAWYRDLIETTRTQYPLFQAIWAQIPDDLEMVPIRTVGPIRFQYDADTVLSFTIYGTDFINDPRFRVVQYHPADPTTITIWNQWVVEEMAKQGKA